MSNLSPSQLRAARALLNLSRADLSNLASVSEQTIHRFENELTAPETRTISRIYDVLTQAGIEFIGDRGLSLRNDVVQTLTGDHAFIRVLEDVGRTLHKTEKPEALFACVCDQVSPSDVIDKYNQLRKDGVRMRSLIRESDTYLLGKLGEYRCLPDRFFHNNTTVIYADKIATMILDPVSGKDTGAVIIRSTHVAAAQRNLFNLIWVNSKSPKKTTAKISYADVTSA